MAFTVEGKDGIEITVGTIEGLRLVLEELSASSDEPSETSEEDSPLLTSERLKEGDTVRILTEPGNYEFGEFHRHLKGSIGIVTEAYSENSVEVEAPSSAKPSELITQMHRSSRLERVEPLGKDANGEDLFEGDYVTGAPNNGYLYTDESIIMKVIPKEDAVGFGIRTNIGVEIAVGFGIGVEIVGEHENSTSSFKVDSERFIRLSTDLDEAKAKFSEINGEEVPEEDDLLPVGTKVRLLHGSSCGDLQKGEVGTIIETDKGCRADLEYKVRVREGWTGYGWLRKDDVEVVEEKSLKVGDKVKVISAEDGTDSGYHGFIIGSIVEVEEVYGNGRIEAYNGNFHQTLLPHHFERESSSTEFRTGDIVRVTETFEDSHGDKALKGKLLEYDNTFRTEFVGTVLLEENHDKIKLVCRKEDRKDIKL